MVWNAFLENEEVQKMTKVYPKCPYCQSNHTCEIVYGYPLDIEEFQKLVSENKIYPGGCCHDKSSPVWHCNNCQNDWGDEKDLEKIDSFDYDQGYNLDEVYDQ